MMSTSLTDASIAITSASMRNPAVNKAKARKKPNMFPPIERAVAFADQVDLDRKRIDPFALLAPDHHNSDNDCTAQSRLDPNLASYDKVDNELLGTAIRAHMLGLTLGLSMFATLFLLLNYPTIGIWRIPFFLATLSLFHSLEYMVTAAYNPAAVSVSSFLLNNGIAYNIAHLVAFTECALHQSSIFSLSSFPALVFTSPYIKPTSGPTSIEIATKAVTVLGLVLLVLGQVARSVAMAHAGSNFNHIVQSSRKADHVLVSHGIYRFLRHPSYFGFFYWGLGTQLVLQNPICFFGYTVVLWRFFSSRIQDEERFLMNFFGDEYIRYRSRTTVGIPLIP